MPAAERPRKSLLLDIPQSGRLAWIAVERGRLEVDGHCLALVQEGGLVEIPPSAFCAVLLEPGVSVTHEAVRLCGETRTSLVWTGEGGTRIYAASSQHADSQRLLDQAQVHLDVKERVKAARRLYELMFSDAVPPSFTIEKLRGIEGAKVREWYKSFCGSVGLDWDGRESKTDLQRCISFASGCLYANAEVAVMTLGYSPAIGVVHSGDARSFVYDIADTVKFSALLPEVIQWFAECGICDYASVRRHCRDLFRRSSMLDKLIENADHVIRGHGRSDS